MSTKTAEAMPNNESSMNRGVMNVYDQPEGRKPGTIDAHWGDLPPARPLGYTGDYGKGVMDQARDVRHGVLGRVFDGIGAARANAKALLDEMLEHAKSDEYEAHTALLTKEKTSAARHLPEA